jgi:hypothetical protein
MKRLIFVLLLVFSGHGAVFSQNIGIGITNPHVDLHLRRPLGRLLLEATNTGIFGSLAFGNPQSENQWQLQATDNTFKCIYTGDLFTTNAINIYANNISALLGINVATPAHALDIDMGDIQLRNSSKGILHNTLNGPLITRGPDPFTSGSYIGASRWGLFKGTNRLILAMPTLAAGTAASIDFSNYTPGGTQLLLASITNNGRFTKPATGNADLVAAAFGSVEANGTVLGGSGNFTIQKTAAGQYHIDLINEGMSASTHTVVVSSREITEILVSARISLSSTAFVRVVDFNNNLYADGGFSFVIYRH